MPVASGCWRRGLIDAITVADGALLVHTDAGAELHIIGERLLRGSGYARASVVVRHELARVGATLRLRGRGLFHVHAAGVVDPTGAAWLLAGDSGSGKSTLAYALARVGWPVLGDDGVLIQKTDRGTLAHAWREPLQVSIELAHTFPELTAHASRVNWSDPRHRAPLSSIRARRASVRSLVFVQRSDRDELSRLSQTEALGALIRQSATVFIADAHSAHHLAALQALVTNVPSFRLEHTPAQLHTIARTLEATLA